MMDHFSVTSALVDPELSEEEIAALAALELDSADSVRAQLQSEVEAYEARMKNWRQQPPSSSTATTRTVDSATAQRTDHDDDVDDEEDGEEDAEEGGGDEPQVDTTPSSPSSSPKKKKMGKKKKPSATKKNPPPTATTTSASKRTPVSSSTTSSVVVDKNGGGVGPHRVVAGAVSVTPMTSSSYTDRSSRASSSRSSLLLQDKDGGNGGSASAAFNRRRHIISSSSVHHLAKDIKPFSFDDLVRAVLTPEERVGGSDMVADSLANVRVAELQGMRMHDSGLLEMLGNLTHLYAQHNQLTELIGLQLCTHVSVVVVHNNRLTSLKDLLDLPCITILDASFNEIESLDVQSGLPNATKLRSLNLLGNPCSPLYVANDPDDVEYVAEYRRAILDVCEHMTYLDNVPVTIDVRIALGLITGTQEPLLTEMARNEHETRQLEASIIKEQGLQTTVTDEDFLIGGMGEQDKNSKPPMIPQTTMSSSDGAGASAIAATMNITDQQRQQGHPLVSMSDRIIAHYERQSAHNRELIDAAVRHSNALFLNGEDDDGSQLAAGSTSQQQQQGGGDRSGRTTRAFDPRLRDVEDDDDDDEGEKHQLQQQTRGGGGGAKPLRQLAEVQEEQSHLRNELRLAMNHHSDVAQVKLEDHWHEKTETLRERQAQNQERRLQMRERLSKPSAAYAAALELLKKESGGGGGGNDDDLDRYRQDPSVFAAQLKLRKAAAGTAAAATTAVVTETTTTLGAALDEHNIPRT